MVGAESWKQGDHVRVSVLVSMLLMSHGAILQSAVGMEIVAQCACGKKGEHTLTLLRDHGVGSTFVFYLSRNGAAPTLLYGSDEEQSRGDDIEVGCVGRHERGLVISGMFASNYIKGTALRFNTRGQRWERVDFAERVRPVSLYFRATGLEVLIPNSGRNESPMRYIIYRYNATIDAARQRYSDSPPTGQAVPISAAGNKGDR